ncbi:hypothetical protein Tam10B_1869 [Bifidobacterium vansinderenii]|uniref:Uncharacterized protein n=1 Tax=Bifidobacterium vansinderenii TaxID=1984871 RepID=A0A229VWC1_9BIFI|nr:hypothetical protein Tam10B_1869 [Bifidobacterium vansinderenii]
MPRTPKSYVGSRTPWADKPTKPTRTKTVKPAKPAFSIEDAVRLDPYLRLMIHRMRKGTWHGR